MDFVILILILVGSLGIILIIYSLANREDNENNAGNSSDSLHSDTLAEVDSALNELTDMSKSVFEEFNGKYQELLFLYKLISDKKEELQSLNNDIRIADPSVAADREARSNASGYDYMVDDYSSSGRHVDFSIDDRSTLLTMLKSDKVKKILAFRKDGLGVSDIAQKMNIGKGEVQMALDLHRMATKGRAKK